MSVLRDAGEAAKGDQRGRRGGFKGQYSLRLKSLKYLNLLHENYNGTYLYHFLPAAESNCFNIVKMIMERNFAPVIVFSFSKKDCEAYALQMSKLNFNSEEEKALVDEVFNNAIDNLSDDDKKLPQVYTAYRTQNVN